MKPLCIDLFCGLGGWAEGFLAEGWVGRAQWHFGSFYLWGDVPGGRVRSLRAYA